MTKEFLLCIAMIFVTVRSVRSQCISANDITASQTNIDNAVGSLVDGNIEFSINLLRTLNMERQFNKDSNGIFFSPLSIWSALMVTYMGSRGATELEMKNVLGIGDIDKVTAWQAFGDINNLNISSYHSANRIYFQKGTSFKDCIREMLDKEIAFLDFIAKAEDSRNEINTWIENQTNQRIKDLIPPGSINTLTRMVVANAVYFKESWLNSFDPQKTVRRRFTTKSRKDVLVNMMNMKGMFLYGKSEELRCYAIEIPYVGHRLSMTILLPKNRYSGVDYLASNLTPERLSNIVDGMYMTNVFVSIPKFKMEDSFELAPVLEKMGLRTLFDQRKVDLSGFTGQKEFKVDAVHHKTFIDVNEEGTEAAGASVLLLSRSGLSKFPISFNADYPFVYLIRENPSGLILFIGTVLEPSE